LGPFSFLLSEVEASAAIARIASADRRTGEIQPSPHGLISLGFSSRIPLRFRMSEEGIICRYIFTSREHRSALRCYWRVSPLKWWLLGLAVFLLGCSLYSTVFPDPTASSAPVSLWSLSLNIAGPVAIMGFLVLYLAYRTRRSFRKSVYFEKEMIYIFRPEGIHLQTPLVTSDMKWETVPRVADNQEGFALFFSGRNSFSWVPKTGFAASDEIDRCRELFRERIKVSKRLFPSQKPAI
jgi:hypothetical protein